MHKCPQCASEMVAGKVAVDAPAVLHALLSPGAPSISTPAGRSQGVTANNCFPSSSHDRPFDVSIANYWLLSETRQWQMPIGMKASGPKRAAWPVTHHDHVKSCDLTQASLYHQSNARCLAEKD